MCLKKELKHAKRCGNVFLKTSTVFFCYLFRVPSNIDDIHVFQRTLYHVEVVRYSGSLKFVCVLVPYIYTKTSPAAFDTNIAYAVT